MNKFISLGLAIIIGIIFGKAINKLKIPAVAGYIVAGLIIGISGFNIVDENLINELGFLSDFALGIIAFNIGSELKYSVIKKLGKSIFIIALCEALGAFVLVTSIMLILNQGVGISLILGAIASATAPAATVMVLKEYKSKGPLTSTLLGVVAIDDAISLMIFSIASAIAKVFIKHETITISKVFIHPISEIIISIIVGGLFGILLSYLLKISRNDSELLSFIVGTIILLMGVANKFDLSPLLSAMSLGIMVANTCRKQRRVFSTIESFSPPIIATFFILAGSRLNVALIPHIGLVGILYLVFRILGKILGASLGGYLSNAQTQVKRYIGLGLLSQVGVAVGLAIIVSKEFAGTNLGNIVITILLSTTILTEIIGPIATKNAIIKAKESNS